MRKILLALAFMVSGLAVAADAGPFYLVPSGFCNIYEVYLSSDGYIYGREVGCTASSVGETRGGFYAGSGNRFAITYPSTSSNGSPDGGVVVLVYDLSNRTRTRAFINGANGGTLTRSTSASFTLTAVKPSNAFASDLPDESR